MMKNSRKRKPEPEAEKPTLDALLQEDPAYQEAFDQKVNQLLRSARTRWEREQAHQPDEEEQLGGHPHPGAGERPAQPGAGGPGTGKAGFCPPADGGGRGPGAPETGSARRLCPVAGRGHPEESAENIDTFELLFQEALAAAVTSRMRGTRRSPGAQPSPGLQQGGAAQYVPPGDQRPLDGSAERPETQLLSEERMTDDGI